MGFRRNRSNAKVTTETTGGKFVEEKGLPKICCDFKALLNGGSDVSFLFETSPTASVSSDGKAVKPLTEKNVEWFACVMWDSQVLEEFKIHEEMKYKLYSTLALGRLLTTCVQEENQSWPGIQLMDWKKPFMMVDIMSSNLGTCGSHPYLRVRETPTGNSPSMATKKPKCWDLIISKEFKSLADEMVRRSRDQVKTTVMLWGACKDVYPVPWNDGTDLVLGEIFLRSWNATKEEPISILIFHQESISKERRELIQKNSEENELWKNFQDPALQYKWFCNSNGSDDQMNHFTLHAVKYCKSFQENETPKDSSSIWEEESMSTFNEDNTPNEDVISDSQKQLLLTQDGGASESADDVLNETVVRKGDLKGSKKWESNSSPNTRSVIAENGAELRRSKRSAVQAVISSPKQSSSPTKKSKQKRDEAAVTAPTQQQDAGSDDEECYRFTALLNDI